MPNGGARGKGSSSGGGKGGKGGGGGGKGVTAGDEDPRWDCHICGLPANFAWRHKCRGCEAKRYLKAAGSATAAAPASGRGNGGQGSSSTLAERQVKQMREELRRQKKVDEDEKRQLREALSRMRAAGASGAAGRAADAEDAEAEVEGEDMDTSANAYASWTEEERQKRLEEARGGLAYLAAKYGEDSEEAIGAKDEIAAIQRASRDAKPFKAHRGLLERKRERLKEKQARDEGEATKIAAEIDELQTKHKGLRAAIEERGKQIGQVEEELAELLRKALAEGDAAGEAGRADDDSSAPWSPQAASAALQALAQRPGVPPEFAALLGHVYQAAQAMANAAAAARPAAAPAPAEGSEEHSHRAGDDKETTNKENNGPLSTKPSGALAPHSRWSKGSAAVAGDAGGEGQPAGKASTGGGGSSSGGGTAGGAAAAAESTGAAASAGSATSKVNGDDEPELIDEDMLSAEMDDGVAESLKKLPSADQERLRAALGARGGRRKPVGEAGGAAARDRERSPRPGRGGGGDDDL